MNKIKRFINSLLNRPCRKQIEINRLRRVLLLIACSRPDQHMDMGENPELTAWIRDTCHSARVGAYRSEVK